MRRALPVLLLLLCGCGPKQPPPPAGTGAREAAEQFFNGLIAHDPARAYDVLDADSRRRVSAEAFAQLARAYSQTVGFAAERVHVRACEEQGDSATAHVVLIGHSAGHARRFNDGATLRRAGDRWGVVLPPTFGRKGK